MKVSTVRVAGARSMPQTFLSSSARDTTTPSCSIRYLSSFISRAVNRTGWS